MPERRCRKSSVFIFEGSAIACRDWSFQITSEDEFDL
jgi:hypothetical protein